MNEAASRTPTGFKVTGTVKFGAPVDPNPDFPNSTGWTVELRYRGRQMGGIPFYTGAALGEPTPTDVLECLLLDATYAEESFYDFAADCGYDEDSHRAREIHAQIRRNTDRLRQLLGSDFAKWQDLAAQQ